MSTPAVISSSFAPSRFLRRQLLVIGLGTTVGLCALVAWPKTVTWLLRADFLPHAYCYLGKAGLVWTHVTADSLIAIAYLTISVTLGYLGYKGRHDIPFHWMFLAFGLFILACGGTHLLDAVTIWIPVYILSVAVKLFTAAVSLTTAAVLPFTVPHAFELVQQAKISEHMTAELRVSEQRKGALLREVHHRVKNNLAVICSLFYLQSIHAQNPETVQVFRDMEGRVHSMALVHESLYRSESLARIDFVDYARALTKDIMASHARPSIPVVLKTELDPVLMSADLAVPCGLIFNELMSNVFKHAFAGGDGGEIKVTLRNQPKGMCTLSVDDNGVGIPADLDVNHSKSLGLRLVQSLTRQIGGEFELLRRDRGTSARLQFTVKDDDI